MTLFLHPFSPVFEFNIIFLLEKCSKIKRGVGWKAAKRCGFCVFQCVVKGNLLRVFRNRHGNVNCWCPLVTFALLKDEIVVWILLTETLHFSGTYATAEGVFSKRMEGWISDTAKAPIYNMANGWPMGQDPRHRHGHGDYPRIDVICRTWLCLRLEVARSRICAWHQVRSICHMIYFHKLDN